MPLDPTAHELCHPPGEGKKIFFGTVASIGVAITLFFFLRLFAKPAPSTMTKEWQGGVQRASKGMAFYVVVPPCLEAVLLTRPPLEQNQKADRSRASLPRAYSGKGMVQSPPAKP